MVIALRLRFIFVASGYGLTFGEGAAESDISHRADALANWLPPVFHDGRRYPCWRSMFTAFLPGQMPLL